MKNILFKIDGRLIKVEHAVFIWRAVPDKTKTFCFTIQLEEAKANSTHINLRMGHTFHALPPPRFGYTYPIDFIDNCYVPDCRSAQYIEYFWLDLPLYKAAVDKFKKLIAFT